MGRRGEYYGRGVRNALWDGKPYETPIVIGWGRVGYYGMGNHSAAEHPKHYGMETCRVLWDGDSWGIMGWGTTALRNPQSIMGWGPPKYYGMAIRGVLWDGDLWGIMGWGFMGYYGMGTCRVLWDGEPQRCGTPKALWDGDLQSIMGWGFMGYYGMEPSRVLWDGEPQHYRNPTALCDGNLVSIMGWEPSGYYGMGNRRTPTVMGWGFLGYYGMETPGVLRDGEARHPNHCGTRKRGSAASRRAIMGCGDLRGLTGAVGADDGREAAEGPDDLPAFVRFEVLDLDQLEEAHGGGGGGEQTGSEGG